MKRSPRTHAWLVLCPWLGVSGCIGPSASPTPVDAATPPDAGDAGRNPVRADGGLDAGRDAARGMEFESDASRCAHHETAFEDFLSTHQACTDHGDCTVIGDCGPYADFRAVRRDAARTARELMEARCVWAWDGELYLAVCESGRCALEVDPTTCCGCEDLDAGR